jgi:hypothetical protein
LDDKQHWPTTRTAATATRGYPSVEIRRSGGATTRSIAAQNTTSLPPMAYEAAAEIDEARVAPTLK